MENAHKKKELVGIDVFVDFKNSVEEVQKKLNLVNDDAVKLTMISNRGRQSLAAQNAGNLMRR